MVGIAMRKISATHCPVPSCPASCELLVDRHDGLLMGVYLLDRVPRDRPVITSFMYGVPKNSDLSTYLDFTHLFAAAPTQFLTPDRSWVLLRYRGSITHAKKVLWAEYNERRRRTDDSAYRSAKGSAFMPPGHVIRVGKAIPIHRAFPDIDSRYRVGLTPGSIHDPKGGEPFRWQSAMVVPTTDRRRKAKSPFTVIRVGDTQIPTASSRAERQLSDALARLGLAICPHLESIRLPSGVVRPDMVVPGERMIVEYDGSYWHHGRANHERDIAKTRKLLDAGWHVVRVREPGLDPLALKAPGFQQIAMRERETGDSLAQRVLSAFP